METPIITRCGFRCDLCPAFRENVERNDRRDRMSEGMSTYFGVTVSADELFCDGCLDEAPGARRIDNKCKIRPCTIEKGFENCAQCGKPKCAKLQSRLVDLPSIEKRIKGSVPKRDYTDLVRPFENKKRLAELGARYAQKPRLLNHEIIPTTERIRAYIGRSMSSHLARIDKYMLESACAGTITYFDSDHGWCISYRRRGVSLASFFPEKNSGTMLVVLGKKELNQLTGLPRGIFDAGLSKIISGTRLGSDGKWLWVPITDAKRAGGIMHLLEIKTGQGIKRSGKGSSGR
jgi:hypothetical protein